MEFSLPTSATAVQRMACDCSVTRVLLSQDSVTIDVGRSKRVISSTLRKALKVRDGHCRWPGCERHASSCDGHPGVVECEFNGVALSAQPRSSAAPLRQT